MGKGLTKRQREILGYVMNSMQQRGYPPSVREIGAALGVSKDAWFFQLYAENLGNSNAATFISTDQFIVAQTPLRPRVIGGTFGFKF